MNIQNIASVSPDRITVRCRSFIRYVHHAEGLIVRSRIRSAFLLVTKGGFHYQFVGGELTLAEGDILYLPEGGQYRYTVGPGETECLQIETEISVDGERTAFSAVPKKLSEELSAMRGLLYNLERCPGEMEKNAAVFALLGKLDERRYAFSKVSPRLAPAVQFLDAHYNEPLYMARVAELCRLSESQLRRLFREELGMSPVAYKNHRRMEKACELLRYTDCRVSEVANGLGFDSVYVFSRVFRRQKGMSPTEYRCRMQEELTEGGRSHGDLQ